jgi:hypothetical protein
VLSTDVMALSTLVNSSRRTPTTPLSLPSIHSPHRPAAANASAPVASCPFRFRYNSITYPLRFRYMSVTRPLRFGTSPARFRRIFVAGGQQQRGMQTDHSEYQTHSAIGMGRSEGDVLMQLLGVQRCHCTHAQLHT